MKTTTKVIVCVFAVVLLTVVAVFVGIKSREGYQTPAYWCREAVFERFLNEHDTEIIAYEIKELNTTPVVENGIAIFKITIYYEDYEMGQIEYLAGIGYKRPKGAGGIYSSELIAESDILDLDIVVLTRAGE